MNKNEKLSNLDVSQMQQRMFDEDYDALRVRVVGAEFKTDNQIPEQKGLEIKEIQVPVIVKEIEIREIEKPVLIKEVDLRIIETPQIIVQEKIQTITIEKPVIVKEIELKTIEKPIIVEKISEVSKLLNYVVIGQTLVIIGLVVSLILRK